MSYQNPNIPFVPNRTILPIHEPTYAPITEMYMDNDPPPPPPRFEVKAPVEAPNVLLVLLDDMGYGCSSAFGGPCEMPTAERLTHKGMRFNRFHTTAVCAPTRAALLSGYNHHSVNMGCITELGTSYPGNNSARPLSITPMAEVLRMNGYSTAQFGKCHEVPAWETSVSGPFDHWPVHSGFDKFYGFIAAESNQFRPNLIDGLNRVNQPYDENYHLTEDLANHCISWISDQKAMTPDKPFFTYFAPGATHAPHHAPKEYLDMYSGKFDEGWDVIRARTLENMKKLGIAPQDAELAPWHPDLKHWDDLNDKQKELYARQMEIYAGFARHTDDQVGRIIDALEEMGILDNTVVFYILGDNGASCEGRIHGVFNEVSTLNHIPEDFDFVYSKKDILGTEAANNHYAMDWAVALDSPFKYAKTMAADFGGTRNGMIAYYPAKFEANGEVHEQFHHVIDIAPTVYELAGIPHPTMVNGVEQKPVEGTSMLYAMCEQNAPGRHKTQYFNVFSNHGLYHDDWFACVVDTLPWSPKSADAPPQKSMPWELYNLKEDFSCSHNLADKYPEKLEELKGIFFQEGLNYNLFPMDGRSNLLFNAKFAGRPTVFGDRKEVTLRAGATPIGEHAFLPVKNCSFEITAEIDVAPGKTDGVLFAQGGRFGGYTLYIKDGKPTFCYNWLAREFYYVKSDKALDTQRNQIRFAFKYDGGTGYHGGAGGLGTLYINNVKVAESRIEHTIGGQISFDETADVGEQRATCVSEEYTIKESVFQGRLYTVNIRITD